MKQIIAFFAFVGLFQLYVCAYYPNFFPYESSNTICTKPGIICKSCNEVVNCIKIQGDKYLEVHVKDCRNDEHGNKQTCLAGRCTTAPNPNCTIAGVPTFKCHNTGVFPDPVDCRVYHMCVENRNNLQPNTDPQADPLHVGVKCDDGYEYNAVTTYCDKKLNNGACTSLLVDCQDNLGLSGGIQGTSIFYVCMEENDLIVPHLFMCPAGSKFETDGCKETDTNNLK